MGFQLSDADISVQDLLTVLDKAKDKAERLEILSRTNFDHLIQHININNPENIQDYIHCFEMCDQYGLNDHRVLLETQLQQPGIIQGNSGDEMTRAAQLLTLFVLANANKNAWQIVSEAKTEITVLVNFIEHFIKAIAPFSEGSDNFVKLIQYLNAHFFSLRNGQISTPAIIAMLQHFSLAQCEWAVSILKDVFFNRDLSEILFKTPADKFPLFIQVHPHFDHLHASFQSNPDISALSGIQDFIYWFEIFKKLEIHTTCAFMKSWLISNIEKLSPAYYEEEYLKLLKIADFDSLVLREILKRAKTQTQTNAHTPTAHLLGIVKTISASDSISALDNLGAEISSAGSFAYDQPYVLSSIFQGLNISQLSTYFRRHPIFINTLSAQIFYEVMDGVNIVDCDYNKKITFAYLLFVHYLDSMLVKLQPDFNYIMQGLSRLLSYDLYGSKKKSEQEEHNNTIWKSMAFESLKLKINELILSVSDINLVFRLVLPEFAGSLYDILTFKIKFFVKNGEDFALVCEHLPADKKEEIFFLLKDELANADFRAIIAHIPHSQIEFVCQQQKSKSPQYTAKEFADILSNLILEIRNWVFEYFQSEIIDSINQAENLPEAFNAILSVLLPNQQHLIYDNVKNNIIKWFKDNENIERANLFFKKMSPVQCEDLCEALRARNLLRLDQLIYLTQEIPRGNAEIILRYFINTSEKFKDMCKMLGPNEIYPSNFKMRLPSLGAEGRSNPGSKLNRASNLDCRAALAMTEFASSSEMGIDELYEFLKPYLMPKLTQISEFQSIIDCLPSQKRLQEKNNIHNIFKNGLPLMIKTKKDIGFIFKDLSIETKNAVGILFIRKGQLCHQEWKKTQSFFTQMSLSQPKIFTAHLNNIEEALIELFDLMTTQPLLAQAWNTVCYPLYGIENEVLTYCRSKLIIHGPKVEPPSLNQQLYGKEKPDQNDERALSLGL